MEAKLVESFLPNLVTAISDCIQPVSDQCLAKGLIPDLVYKQVLESGGTSDDKARTLILAVKNSTETDDKCLRIFLKILEEQLPYRIKGKLLSDIRNKIAENTITEADVPKCTPPQSIPSEELAKECFTLPNYLLGRFEKAVREHERAITEKILLEEKLKSKSTSIDDKESDLKVKIEQIENRMGKLDMQVRRGRNMVTTETQEWFAQLAKHHEQQTEIARRETEEVTQKKMEDQIRTRELEHNVEMQERDHKLETQQKLQASNNLEASIFDIDPPDRLKSFEVRPNEVNLHTAIKRQDPKFLKWRELGSKLGFSKENLDEVESSVHNKYYSHCSVDQISRVEDIRHRYITEMLNQWFESYPGDSRGSKSFATYTWLKRALLEAGLGPSARDLPSYDKLIVKKPNFN